MLYGDLLVSRWADAPAGSADRSFALLNEAAAHLSAAKQARRTPNWGSAIFLRSGPVIRVSPIPSGAPDSRSRNLLYPSPIAAERASSSSGSLISPQRGTHNRVSSI